MPKTTNATDKSAPIEEPRSAMPAPTSVSPAAAPAPAAPPPPAVPRPREDPRPRLDAKIAAYERAFGVTHDSRYGALMRAAEASQDKAVRAAHRTAVGVAPPEHPHLTLMRSARASGDPSVMAAVVDHVEENAPSTVNALEQIASEESGIAPALLLEIDVQRPAAGDLDRVNHDQFLARDGALRHRWTYRRELPVNIAGDPIAARILVAPGGLDARLLESTFRNLGRHMIDASPAAADQARTVLLTAAALRAAAR